MNLEPLGSKIELMEANTKLVESSVQHGDMVKYKKLLDYQEKINETLNELYKTLDQAHNDGLSLDEVKSLIKA